MTQIRDLLNNIKEKSNRPLTIMEVCGTHTMSIARFGIRDMLPSNIRLVSGPGCPVCVTSAEDISAALCLAEQDDVILTTFGDMLHVPAGKLSLYELKQRGADVRIVLSPLDALILAKQFPEKKVVFFAVGFETTAPLTAALIMRAAEECISNLYVYSAHKTMPAAIRTLFSEENNVDALLCPGHVAVISGSEYFRFVPDELAKPAAVAGFECEEILGAISAILEMFHEDVTDLVNCYEDAVTAAGNPIAQQFADIVFDTCDAVWRGFGLIPESGLRINTEYCKFDAAIVFAEALSKAEVFNDYAGCRCGEVLRGKIMPQDCPLFGSACCPDSPKGACMVSSEGSCAAAIRYKTWR